MREVLLAASIRTPIGKFGGTLKDWSASDLAVPVVEEVFKRTAIAPDLVDEVIIGTARQAGGGPNVARQISYRARIPESVPAYTVNKACGSGLKAIILASQEIAPHDLPLDHREPLDVGVVGDPRGRLQA